MWTSSDQLTIQHYHQQVQGSCLAPDFQSHMKIVFSCWETAHKCMTFPRHPTNWLQAAGSRVKWLYPCALPVQTVSIYKGEDSALSSVVNDPVCSQGEWWWEANFPRRKLIPGGLQYLTERGSPGQPWIYKQICSLWTLLPGWAIVRTVKSTRGTWHSMCQGHMTFFDCQGHKLSFKIMRPHHQCWTLPSQVWLALFYCCNPTPDRSLGPAFQLHLWFTVFNSESFVIS